MVHSTRRTLLWRMRDPHAERAWEEFYQMYWAVIVRYAQKMGLNEAEAQDVLQETMMVLLRILPQFQYDPAKGKFRNFLLTIVRRKALAAWRRAAARGEVSFDTCPHDDGLSPADTLSDENIVAPSDTDQRRWRESIQEQALQRIRDDASVQGRTWDVFQAYVLDQLPVAEVVQRFGMKKNAVYQIKNRMIKRLKEEVERLTTEISE